MSIAPANKASIAEGPALKLFQSILTWGPIALSNHPLFLPTIACGCVILGNAPTRMTLCAPANTPSKKNTSAETKKFRLIMALASSQHRQHSGLGLFLPVGLPVNGLLNGLRTGPGRPAADQVGQRRILQNRGGRIPYLQKHLVQGAMVRIAIDQSAQLVRISEGRERPVDQTDDFAQPDLGWRPAQPVSALGAAHALHDARILQFQKNQLQKLFRQIFFVSNVANSDRTLGVAPGQQHHRLQRIQPFLGNLHSVPAPDYPYVRDRHYRKGKRTTKALNFLALAGPVISASYRWKKDSKRGACARLCTFGKVDML